MPELPFTPAQDDGEADPRLAAASSRAEVLAALVDARVFAGIAATSTAEHVTAQGLRADSSAQLAVLLLEVAGERALPVFPSVAALRRWRLDARPVPLTGPQACQAALDEGAQALVLDPAGSGLVLSVGELRSVASGWVPVPDSRLATRRGHTELKPPAVPVPAGLIAALRQALRQEDLVRSARLLEGPDGLVLGVVSRRPLPATELASIAQRLLTRLGPDLPVGGLDLAQVSRRGAGLPVLRRGFRRVR